MKHQSSSALQDLILIIETTCQFFADFFKITQGILLTMFFLLIVEHYNEQIP